MTVLLCPLCSQPRFNNLESLRVSLVNAATQSISCPICDDILMGLDKLTIHLFGHTLNQNSDSTQRPSLELKTSKTIEDECETRKPEETYQNSGEERHEVVVSFTEPVNNANDKLFNEIETFCSDEAPKIFHEEVRSDMCTVNMEDLSFLTSWENNLKPKQDQKESENQTNSADKHNGDLSEYMSDLLNKKLPILNFSFTLDNSDKSKTHEDENKQITCGVCSIAFQNSLILSLHEELVHNKKEGKGVEEGMENFNQKFYGQKEPDFDTHTKLADEKNEFFSPILDNNDGVEVKSVQSRNIEQQKTGEKSITEVHVEGLEGTLPRYDCHLCSKSFKMKGSLLLHFRVAHFGLNSVQILGDVPSPEERNHICPICTKTFKKEQHLTQHIKTHEGKQWQCETCSKHFTTKYFLKKHQRLHTGEMPYSCPTCKKTFTFQQSYHKHLLYHSDEKPHQCKQCGRSFKELSTLHNHQRIHSGEKPFACEACGKCFRQRVSYIVHQRIHTGVLPYQCTACKKKFRYKVSQRSHKCTAQPPGIVIRQPDIVQKILENKQMLQQKPT